VADVVVLQRWSSRSRQWGREDAMALRWRAAAGGAVPVVARSRNVARQFAEMVPIHKIRRSRKGKNGDR
jgi:hypothetical protein